MTPNPPTLQETDTKMQKCRRRRHNALWRFLAMPAMIRRILAPDFNGAHPQGVQWDSLEGLMAVGVGQLVDTLALHAFFVRAASATNLYVF